MGAQVPVTRVRDIPHRVIEYSAPAHLEYTLYHAVAVALEEHPEWFVMGLTTEYDAGFEDIRLTVFYAIGADNAS